MDVLFGIVQMREGKLSNSSGRHYVPTTIQASYNDDTKSLFSVGRFYYVCVKSRFDLWEALVQSGMVPTNGADLFAPIVVPSERERRKKEEEDFQTR